MKIIIASMVLTTLVYGEVPPANSYLPPAPPGRGGSGYPQNSAPSQNFAPQIVAARSLEGPQGSLANPGNSARGSHSLQVNPFGRSNHAGQPHNHATSRFANEEPVGYEGNGGNFARNALEETNGEPANYNFGYMVNDYQEGTDFGHCEERQEERAQGEYHVVLPDGRKQTVSYEADERGFKPQISYEDTEDIARSAGYDTNANNVRSGGNYGSSNYAHGNGGTHDNFGARSKGY